MPDKYHDFEELRHAEREGADYRIRIIARAASIAVVAPHAGRIEPGTSLVSSAIAGANWTLYRFEGLKAEHRNRELHVTSHRFDEPRCLELLARAEFGIGVHGVAAENVGRETGDKFVLVGGLHGLARDQVTVTLRDAGFEAHAETSGRLAARHPNNVCNRPRRNGIQIELSFALRTKLCSRSQRPHLRKFAAAVRSGIEASF